jgi:hypothetical protein
MASCCRKVQQTPNDGFVGKPAIKIPTDNINEYQKSDQYIQFKLRPLLA